MKALLASALADFLRGRRGQLDPVTFGLPDRGRRVSGLRRQEFAELAGLSVEYYIKLEQGRAGNPSAAVLASISDVLGLDRAERTYLWGVAQFEERFASETEEHLPLPLPVKHLLQALSELAPSFILTPATDIVARNSAGAIVFGSEPRNVARSLFLDPVVQDLYGDRENHMREQVAWLRYDMVAHYGDAELVSLIEEMLEASPTFAELWALQEVSRRSHGRRVIHHPTAGKLEFYYTALPLPADPRLTIVTWSAPEGSVTAERLQKLIAETPDQGPGLLESIPG